MRDAASILVVDDEPVVCASCSRILTEEGHNVSAAFSGEEAIHKLEDMHFDLALVDLKLPSPGGFAVLRHLRRTFPEIEVVVITGYPSIESAKEAIRLGAFDYVPKPLEPETVSGVVTKALECKPWRLQRRWYHDSSA